MDARPSNIELRAGKWTHEIVFRFFYTVLALFLVSFPVGHIVVYTTFFSSSKLADYAVFGLAGIFMGLPEVLLRRKLRLGLLTLLACGTALPLSLALAQHLGNFDFHQHLPIGLATLGGTLGLCAGIGARSLLAVLLGFIAGQGAGFLAGQSYSWILAHRLQGPFPWEIFQILAVLLLPIGLTVGLAVWAGVRFSRRAPPKPLSTPPSSEV